MKIRLLTFIKVIFLALGVGALITYENIIPRFGIFILSITVWLWLSSVRNKMVRFKNFEEWHTKIIAHLRSLMDEKGYGYWYIIGCTYDPKRKFLQNLISNKYYLKESYHIRARLTPTGKREIVHVYHDEGVEKHEIIVSTTLKPEYLVFPDMVADRVFTWLEKKLKVAEAAEFPEAS